MIELGIGELFCRSHSRHALYFDSKTIFILSSLICVCNISSVFRKWAPFNRFHTCSIITGHKEKFHLFPKTCQKPKISEEAIQPFDTSANSQQMVAFENKMS